jgi:hypothetical protein
MSKKEKTEILFQTSAALEHRGNTRNMHRIKRYDKFKKKKGSFRVVWKVGIVF